MRTVAPVDGASRHVLGFTVTVRSARLGHLDEVDHRVLRPHSRLLGQQLGDLLVQVLLLLQWAPLVEGDLDEDDIVGALDVQLGRVVDQAVFAMLGNDRKLIVFRGANRFDQGTVDAIGEDPPVLGGLLFIRSMRTCGMLLCTSREPYPDHDNKLRTSHLLASCLVYLLYLPRSRYQLSSHHKPDSAFAVKVSA
jgi:hypothetical protein